ncbi:glycogen/starch/alpha-glucan phosphorylase [Paenibacillus albiflavus]|uniref:Alpha-1,4 glucan phosphorylase n=1 Tax=Paenibacillus albiflavus TaxID=2545760 RepID=A0A4R4ENP5_9BACL|nr:glycogen/starch/alpha-glucan phosphorylase [Paenibacillus albiflavus]TCZ80055.1 glycogen/starch/alpha-glucan phosphorylase [Paenibacillus albiflavus]
MFTNKTTFKQAFVDSIENKLGKTLQEASGLDIYNVLGHLIREYIGKDWMHTNKEYEAQQEKQIYYFSMEFLIGRLLGNNLLNLGTLQLVREALQELGLNLEEIEEQEHDAGLGNGGLGRLAACFLDSLATLQYPGHGCGIRYQYGLFEQKIINGYQVELPDYWLQKEYVWDIRRSDKKVGVRFGGHVISRELNGRMVYEHRDYEHVWAVPYDVPVVGYHYHNVNTLRLWSAESSQELGSYSNPADQNYYKFLAYSRSVQSISEFLYPDDSSYEGKQLRLKQQYFLCSAGLQSILRTFDKSGLSYYHLPSKVAIHINDTHPTLLIPELMRILIDDKNLGWEDAWDITTQTISYTNHTTLSEGLEKWPVHMVKELLPRIYMIIEEINERFCHLLWNLYPGQFNRIAQMAIIADDQVKMAHLAIVGSYSINGVAELHTQILKEREMKLFYEVFPQRFNNKTNGITHRRWLMHANPKLSNLITETIGHQWIAEPEQLIRLAPHAQDSSLQEEVARIKQQNKRKLATYIERNYPISIDPTSLFDVLAKRLHGYKRQLLSVLHIMHLYNQITDNPSIDMLPRTFIFGAKAAPNYHLAKKVIKLIHSVADTINRDPIASKLIKVVFLENYGVSLAEKIMPAAEISEQISTAGKEASGTSNMKFMMNGALTIATLDGANIEMQNLVGQEAMFIFGLRSEEIAHYNQFGDYQAKLLYESTPSIKRVMDQLILNSPYTRANNDFQDIYNSILKTNDEFFVLKDFDSYAAAQQRIDAEYRQSRSWLEKSIINIAHSGKFASDRTIAEYASEIWDTHPVPVHLARVHS